MLEEKFIVLMLEHFDDMAIYNFVSTLLLNPSKFMVNSSVFRYLLEGLFK